MKGDDTAEEGGRREEGREEGGRKPSSATGGLTFALALLAHASGVASLCMAQDAAAAQANICGSSVARPQIPGSWLTLLACGARAKTLYGAPAGIAACVCCRDASAWHGGEGLALANARTPAPSGAINAVGRTRTRASKAGETRYRAHHAGAPVLHAARQAQRRASASAC